MKFFKLEFFMSLIMLVTSIISYCSGEQPTWLLYFCVLTCWIVTSFDGILNEIGENISSVCEEEEYDSDN